MGGFVLGSVMAQVHGEKIICLVKKTPQKDGCLPCSLVLWLQCYGRIGVWCDSSFSDCDSVFIVYNLWCIV